jgi:streptogramin lyase
MARPKVKARQGGWLRPAVEGLESRRLMAVTITEFPLASAGTQVNGITNGPGGNLWFAATGPAEIGVFNPVSNQSQEFPLRVVGSAPAGITQGPNGTLFFADPGTSSVGAFNPFTLNQIEFPTLTPLSGPTSVAAASNGFIWFTETAVGQIGVLNPSNGAIAEFPLASKTSAPAGIILGPDGNLWFTEAGGVGSINPATDAITFTPVNGTTSTGLTVGPDNQIWFSFQSRSSLYVAEINTSSRAISFFPTGVTYGGSPDRQTGFATGADGNIYFGNNSGTSTTASIGEFNTTTHAVSFYPTKAANGTSSRVFSIVAGPLGDLWFGDTGSIGQATILPTTQSALTGQVTQALSGTPLAGQTVFIDLFGTGTPAPGDPSAVTDASGNYEITGIVPGTFTVRVVTFPGFVAPPAVVTLVGGGITPGVNLTIQPASAQLPLSIPVNPFGTHNPDLPTAEVNGLYNIILGRAPDPSGLANSVAYLRSGGSVQTLATVLLNSPEYQSRLVASYYQSFLGRSASPAEVAGWVNLIENGGYSDQQVLLLMLSSAGYNALHPDNASFITSLYTGLFGRNPTAAELTGWESILASPTSQRVIVISQFLHSAAAYQLQAQGLYAAFWGAPIDATGQANVVQALNFYATLPGMAATFAGSPPFIQRAAATVG